MSFNGINGVYRNDIVNAEKVLIDVKGLYRIEDLRASGMK